MKEIVISTTFRDFVGDKNDKMQLDFLRSLSRQTYEKFHLVVTIFGEKKVEEIVRSALGNKCSFIHDDMGGNYKFSLSKTFKNGVDYGLLHNAEIILDCSSDIILQKNFLEITAKRCGRNEAGISHPNIFCETVEDKKIYKMGSVFKGIDARFFSLDIFKNPHVYDLLQKYPSYDYGAGIECFLCGIAIKYASARYNIFMESKVIKRENERNTEVNNKNFISEGFARNWPTVKRFFRTENLDADYISTHKVNYRYRISKDKLTYWSLILNNNKIKDLLK